MSLGVTSVPQPVAHLSKAFQNIASALPKRPLNSYFIYVKDRRDTLTMQHPNYTFGEKARIITKEWAALSEDKKRMYKSQAEALKADYLRQMEELEQKAKRDPVLKAKIDALKNQKMIYRELRKSKRMMKEAGISAKRPPSAFNLFQMQEWTKMKGDSSKTTTGLGQFAQFTRGASATWAKMEEGARKPFVVEAAKLKAQNDAKMQGHKDLVDNYRKILKSKQELEAFVKQM